MRYDADDADDEADDEDDDTRAHNPVPNFTVRTIAPRRHGDNKALAGGSPSASSSSSSSPNIGLINAAKPKRTIDSVGFGLAAFCNQKPKRNLFVRNSNISFCCVFVCVCVCTANEWRICHWHISKWMGNKGACLFWHTKKTARGLAFFFVRCGV